MPDAPRPEALAMAREIVPCPPLPNEYACGPRINDREPGFVCRTHRTIAHALDGLMGERDWNKRMHRLENERANAAWAKRNEADRRLATERAARQAAEQRADEKTQWLINAEEGYREEHEARQAAEAMNGEKDDKAARLHAAVSDGIANTADIRLALRQLLALTPETLRERWAAERAVIEAALVLRESWGGKSAIPYTRLHQQWCLAVDALAALRAGDAG